MLLDWFINPDHGPLYVARERGYFAEAGLAVEFTPPADPNDPPKIVAGRARRTSRFPTSRNCICRAAAGLPLARIGTLVATPLNTIVVLDESPIRTIADLKGKRVGFSVAGLEDALLEGVLQPHGLTMDDIEKVNVNWSLSPSLIAGRVDAVIGAFRNFELNQMGHCGLSGPRLLPGGRRCAAL